MSVTPTVIDPAQIPTKAPGTIFDALTGGDATLAIRWFQPTDPVFFAVLNRPIADITVRQLVLAKAIDNLELSLGNQALFPFLVQPRVASGTLEVDVPLNLIWDLHASLPKKWENLRLAKIKRISGVNSSTDGYTGKLRFIFTANINGSATEVAVLYADYQIDSILTYQLERLTPVATPEESVVINAGEQETVSGFITFRTMDTALDNVALFLQVVAPPTDTSSATNGIYDNPAIYELSDTNSGSTSVTGDFSLTPLNHGTGLLTDSSWNAIPQLDSDIQAWLVSFNYPFASSATRMSSVGITIPAGLFQEFNMTVPAGDQPTGDSSGTFFPVWINRIEKVSTGSTLRFHFATYNVTDTASGGTPSTTVVEFATLDLVKTAVEGDIVEIVPSDNLQLQVGTLEEFGQHFGRGHVVLSSLWGSTSSDVADFFDAFDALITSPADTEFSQASTRLSAFGLSRVPKYVPTIGQSRALNGSTSRLSTPINPSYDNRFVTEADQGLGDTIDLDSETGITPQTAIERYGHTGGLCHRVARLVINGELLGNDPNYYTSHILPRLTILFGRAPQFGDMYYNGTRVLFYNGDAWQSLG